MSAPNNSNFLSHSSRLGKNASNAASGTASQTVTRTLCVHIEGSLTDMAHRGNLAGLWKGMNGRESMLFHPNLEESMGGNNDEKNSAVVNNLRNGVIKRITLKEQQSSFPFLLGVDISCVPPNEVTNIGEKWAYCVLPNSNISSPQTVYLCDNATQDNSAWHQMYSQWNSSNLETHGVMDVPNQPFLFVHMDHPVIGLLRFNQNMIGCDIDTQPKLEKEYFKISKQVMSTCCDTIRSDVLSKMKTRDLNCFTLQLRRMNNTGWDELDHNAMLGMQADYSLSEEEQHKRRAAYLKDYMTKPYQYIARLEVEYEIPAPVAA